MGSAIIATRQTTRSTPLLAPAATSIPTNGTMKPVQTRTRPSVRRCLCSSHNQYSTFALLRRIIATIA